MQSDPYRYHARGLEAPAQYHAAITPSDSADIPTRPRALFVTEAGDLTIRDGNGITLTYAVEPGLLPFSPVRVMATGTTATVIGWW